MALRPSVPCFLPCCPLLLCVAVLFLAAPAAAQDPSRIADAIRHLEWRPIGPANMGGRVTDIAGIPGDPKIFYVAGADGGLFRTTNAGVTFDELFTDQAYYSVGAIAIAPSDVNVIWLGTGEGDPRNSVSYGNGVYRSVDRGDTWKHVGLDGTERIKRIAIDPRDPDVAYVCALGREWGSNADRGVFKTSDGGGTWVKVLYLDENTGCSDLAMDLSNPRILFAGMWTFRRRPWRFDDGGGETALYRSKDGGTTWEKLTNGLPEGPMARIGVAIARSDPEIMYMVTEAKHEGTLFRSEDGGDTWRMVHDNPNINFRPFYYSDIRVDPNNPNIVYSLSGGLYKSIDGGRTFNRIARGVHGDHQSFWIDPLDSDRILSGSDGGFQISYDAGETWDIINNVTLAQFYQIDVDDQDPYYVCGGLQDNGNWCGPSNSLHSAGIIKDDWFRISGGDGFYSQSVPGRPHLIYTNSQGGNIMLTDTRSGATRRIHPYPKIVGSAGDAMLGHEYRFNWDAPIHLSPHDPATVYWGGNVLFRSRDFGYTWNVISPDLTTNDPEKQRSSGGEIYTDNTAAEFHTTILTIAESSVEADVIWVGTDDGNIQITRDGGATWTEVGRRIRGLPAYAWIAKIEASPHDSGTAFVAVDNHRSDDFRPYVFMTTDYGRNWRNLSTALPQDDYVKVVRQDPRNPNLLYVGMERGIYASWEMGRNWISIRNGLPAVSVRDIQIQRRENDLVIGTHGRGAYILDDLTPLQALTDALDGDATLFPIRRATRWQIASRDASLGQRSYRAANPPRGALIHFYLRAAPEREVTLSIADAAGEEIRSITLRDLEAGVNRTVWDLRYEAPTPIRDQESGGRGGFFRARGGPLAPPGRYRVALSGGDWQVSGDLELRGDPRIEMSDADYRAQFDALITLRGMASEINEAINLSKSIVSQLADIHDVVSHADDMEDAGLADTVTAAIDSLEAVTAEYLRRPPPRMTYRQRPRVSEEIRSLMFAIGGVTARPTEPQVTRMRQLRDEADSALVALDRIIDGQIRPLNQRLGSYPRIMVGSRGGTRPRATSGG